MKIIKYFSNLIEKVRNENQLLLKVPKKRYAELINELDTDSLNIIGKFDRFNPGIIEDLEL